jgi:hypothetical protein
MDRKSYKLDIAIMGFDASQKEAIVNAANSMAQFEWNKSGKNLYAIGEGPSLPYESESEFAKRLCGAIWQANKKYCRVSVVSVSLTSDEKSIDNEKNLTNSLE